MILEDYSLMKINKDGCLKNGNLDFLTIDELAISDIFDQFLIKKLITICQDMNNTKFILALNAYESDFKYNNFFYIYEITLALLLLIFFYH